MTELAWIVQGEAGICGFQAMLAVAWVYSRNRTFYGRAQPSAIAWFVAEHWQEFPDPTHGSVFLVNDLDLRDPRVQAFARGEPSAVFRCAAGRRLYAFGGRVREPAHGASFHSPPLWVRGFGGWPLTRLPRVV